MYPRELLGHLIRGGIKTTILRSLPFYTEPILQKQVQRTQPAKSTSNIDERAMNRCSASNAQPMSLGTEDGRKYSNNAFASKKYGNIQQEDSNTIRLSAQQTLRQPLMLSSARLNKRIPLETDADVLFYQIGTMTTRRPHVYVRSDMGNTAVYSSNHVASSRAKSAADEAKNLDILRHTYRMLPAARTTIAIFLPLTWPSAAFIPLK